MALTNLQKLRLTIADKEKVKTEEIIGVGNNTRKKWVLEMHPIKADSEAIVINNTATSAYDLDGDTGLVEFTTAPSNKLVIKALVYSFYAFSDDDLNDILDDENNAILMAAARCYRILAADAAKFFVWTSGDEKVDKSKICANFLKVAESIEERARKVPYVGSEYWKIEERDFGDEVDIDRTTHLDEDVG